MSAQPASDRPGSRGSRPDVSIVTSGHDVADARIHRMAGALVRRGLRVELLGLGDPADAPAGIAVRTVPRPGLVKRASLAARYAAQARGRVLVALDPDSLTAITAAARATRAKVVADVHEDYAALLRDRGWARRAGGVPGRLAAAVVAAATKAAAVADLTLVADEHVPPMRARRRLVVRNLPDITLLGEPVEPEAAPRAVYVGDVRRTRGLHAMMEAIALCPAWSLDVVGPVAPADQAWLAGRLGGDRDLAARVRFHGRQPPQRAWEIAAGGWVGLALLDDTPAFRDAIPSKVYEYVALGLVPVVTDLPRQAAVAASAGGAVVSAQDPVPGLVALLTAYAEEPSAYADARSGALTKGADLRAAPSPFDEAAEAIEELIR